AASALRSATVTGDRSGLSSTAILCRKCGRMASPAVSARSAASARKPSSSPTILLLQAFEVGHHIRSVLHLRQAGKGHLRTLREVLRPIEPHIELVRVPLLALVRRECLRELVIRHGCDVFFEDPEQVRADLVRPAFVESVALQAD